MWIRTRALFSTGSLVDEDETDWGDFVFCTDSLESFNRADDGLNTTLRFVSGGAYTVEIDFESFFDMLQNEIVVYGSN